MVSSQRLSSLPLTHRGGALAPDPVRDAHVAEESGTLGSGAVSSSLMTRRRSAAPPWTLRLVALAGGLVTLLSACSFGLRVDTAARDRCESKWGVGNCVERNGTWVPLASATSTTSTAAPSTTSASSTTTTTTAPVPTTTVPAPTTTATPSTQDPAFALDLFAQLRAEHCEAGATPEPVEARPGPADSEVIITDAAADTVVLNTADSTVYSLDGPEGILPMSYSFGCSEAVFLGTMDH